MGPLGLRLTIERDPPPRPMAAARERPAVLAAPARFVRGRADPGASAQPRRALGRESAAAPPPVVRLVISRRPCFLLSFLVASFFVSTISIILVFKVQVLCSYFLEGIATAGRH